LGEVHGDLVGWVERRAEPAEVDDRGEDRHAGDGQLVFEEDVQAAAEGAARFARGQHARRRGGIVLGRDGRQPAERRVRRYLLRWQGYRLGRQAEGHAFTYLTRGARTA